MRNRCQKSNNCVEDRREKMGSSLFTEDAFTTPCAPERVARSQSQAVCSIDKVLWVYQLPQEVIRSWTIQKHQDSRDRNRTKALILEPKNRFKLLIYRYKKEDTDQAHA